MIRMSLASSQAAPRSCVQMCLSALLSILCLTEAICLPVLLTFERLSILLTTGGCFKSYYVTVLISLLLGCWHIGIVIKRDVSDRKIICMGVLDLVMARAGLSIVPVVPWEGTQLIANFFNTLC